MSSFLMSPVSPARLRSDLYRVAFDDEPEKAPVVISVLASLLERTIVRNERLTEQCFTGNSSPEKRTGGNFYSHRVLDMSIRSFLERIFRYARVSPQVYVVAYVYLDRLCQTNPSLKLSSGNVHRLLVTAVMVASKFVEDRNYKNSYFAAVGGLSTEELNSLEIRFLFLMKFKLHVSVSVFESYCSHLEREVSFGGGYQIERTLRFMCSSQMVSKETHTRESNNQLAKVP